MVKQTMVPRYAIDAEMVAPSSKAASTFKKKSGKKERKFVRPLEHVFFMYICMCLPLIAKIFFEPRPTGAGALRAAPYGRGPTGRSASVDHLPSSATRACGHLQS